MGRDWPRHGDHGRRRRGRRIHLGAAGSWWSRGNAFLLCVTTAFSFGGGLGVYTDPQPMHFLPLGPSQAALRGEEKTLKGAARARVPAPFAHGFSLEQLELGPAGNGAGLSAAAPRCLPFPTAVPPALQNTLGCSFGNLADRSSISLLRALLSLCDPCSCCFSSLPLPGGPGGSLFELLVYFVTFSRVGLLQSGHTQPLPPSRPILSVLSCPAPLSL